MWRIADSGNQQFFTDRRSLARCFGWRTDRARPCGVPFGGQTNSRRALSLPGSRGLPSATSAPNAPPGVTALARQARFGWASRAKSACPARNSPASAWSVSSFHLRLTLISNILTKVGFGSLAQRLRRVRTPRLRLEPIASIRCRLSHCQNGFGAFVGYPTKDRNFATTRVGRRGGRRSGDHRDLTGVLTKHVEEVDHLAANIAARFDF